MKINNGVKPMNTIKFSLSLTIALSFLLVGCSKPPKPIELDGDSAITINQELIRMKYREVPLDRFLSNNNWTYNLEFTKKEDVFIPNDMIVKAFYVAHNADKIIIVGHNNIANAYKNYFIENQVKADISIHHVDSIENSKNRVNVLFFGKKRYK